MLVELHVQNLAIIDDLSLSLDPHFNVLTGETGAGKTILVSALDWVRGAKAETTLIRSGTEQASVTATFEMENPSAPLLEMLSPFHWTPGEPLLLRRVVLREGKSRGYVNGIPVPMLTLKMLGEWLFDFASQHEQQRLLDSETHVDILDGWAEIYPLRKEFSERFGNFRTALQELSELEEREKQSKEQLDWIQFQFKELKSANLQIGEEEDLENQRNRLRYGSQLFEMLALAEEKLSSGSQSATLSLGEALKTLEKASQTDPSLQNVLKTLEEALVGAEEVARDLKNYVAHLENRPMDLEAIESRLALIQQLKRKHKMDVEGLLKKQEELKESIALVDNFDSIKKSKKKQVEEFLSRVKQQGKKISDLRQKAAKSLSRKIETELGDLHMSKTQFFIQIQKLDQSEWTPKGIDRLEFLISPNIGEPVKPLVKIASGGELSRILLAIKKVLMDKTLLADTYIFDEIDSGVGGSTATAVGKKMAELSLHHQVIAITHLPQVASFGKKHFKIYKDVEGGRTRTRIEELETGSRSEEIARMLGGAQITKITRDHASEMLEKSSFFKS